MRAFFAAVFAAAASADITDFPKDDAMHADCHVTAVFAGVSCSTIYAEIDAEIRAWGEDTTSPAGGVYELKEEKVDSYVWSTRLTRDKKYTDDNLFPLEETDEGCTVAGHSRSIHTSIYDYSVNFCNLWNVYNGIGGFTYTVGDCAYPASDPVTTCARY